jgi:hypothetical protein
VINWSAIGEAVQYYRRHGFTYVEVPWIVPRAVIDVTIPPGHVPHETTGGALVGSAEQSFVAMMLDGQLKRGESYVAASPCFRDDPPDRLHQTTFFKVELVYISDGQDPWDEDLKRKFAHGMALTAQRFFHSTLLPKGSPATSIVQTADGYDIEYQGIELGSYGVRGHNGWTWVYGTGLAEPRFSIATKG